MELDAEYGLVIVARACNFAHMPHDRLTLAIGVGCQVDGFGGLNCALRSLTVLLLSRGTTY